MCGMCNIRGSSLQPPASSLQPFTLLAFTISLPSITVKMNELWTFGLASFPVSMWTQDSPMSLLLQSTEVQGYGLNGPDKQIARMTALLAGINVSEFRNYFP